jgi:hypothetical protein
MSPPLGSLGFLNEKVWLHRSIGRIRDRLRRGCPYGGQFALSIPKGDDRNADPGGQPLSHTKYSPPARAASADHLPRRRHRWADVFDECSRGRRTGAL